MDLHRLHSWRLAAPAALAAGALSLAGCGVWRSDSGDTAAAVAGQDAAGAGNPAQGQDTSYSWRVVDGTVTVFRSNLVTTGGGVSYVVSTAPGTRFEDAVGGQVPTAIYQTTDGETWESSLLGERVWSRLSERDGVLYAIATAPGGDGAATTASLGVSSDGGASWTETTLPIEITRPQTSTELYGSTMVGLGVTSDVTAALVSGSFFVDAAPVIAEHFGAAAAGATWYQATEGLTVKELSDCEPAASDETRDRVVGPAAGARIDLCETDIGVLSWADLDVGDPASLQQRHLLLSTDGSTWDEVPLPVDPGAIGVELHATSTGLLLIADRAATDGSQLAAGTSTRIFHSADGRSWTESASAANLWVSAVSGDRVIGTTQDGSLLVSGDGGVSFERRNLLALIPHQGEAFVSMSAAGPLGFAALVTVIEPVQQAAPDGADLEPEVRPQPDAGGGELAVPVPAGGFVEPDEHSYLLTSTDGASWSVTDVAAAGMPATGWVSQLMVGANHVGVGFVASTPTGGGGVENQSGVLLGTPER